ncbi:MAG: 4a-hydroxytetrahydrobiopterin dehydratase [Pirellulaceae bacterium]
MEVQSTDSLAKQKCKPCEGGVDPCPLSFSQNQLSELPGWHLTHEGKRIRKEWEMKDFLTGLRFFQDVAVVAEDDGHHPDLHLEGYKYVSIELWTHAIGGLSENDFILAAKIDKIATNYQ